MSYVFPSTLVPLVLSKFLAGQIEEAVHTSHSSCTLLDGVFFTFHCSQHVEDVPHWCPIIKGLVRDVLVGQMLKGLPSLQLTLWLLREMCYAVMVSLPPSIRWWQGQVKIYNKGLPAMLEGMGKLVCSRGCT